MRRIIKGNTACGKTNNAISRYNMMLSDSIDSNSILVLVSNRWERYRWLQEIEFSSSSSNHIYSYFAFVQREVTMYWHHILKKCPLIRVKTLTPTLMHFESSQSLMYKTIEYYRKKGHLEDTISSDEAISRKLLSNLVSASLSNTNYKNIGRRVYTSKLEEKKLPPKFYKDFNEIIDKYVERTLSEGILDQATSIYLYSNYLLKDEKYLSNLRERYQFLIVDDLELAPISEVDFIISMCDWLKGAILYENTDGPYGIYQFGHSYLKKHLIPLFDADYLEENNHFKEVLLSLGDSIFYSKGAPKKFDNVFLDIDDEHKGKSDRRLLRRIHTLLSQGVKPGDIAIVVPRYDPIIDFGLTKIAKEFNIKYLYTSKDEKVTDNIQVFSLLVFAIIFYDIKKLPLNYDEVKSFLMGILRVNPIVASLLTDFLYKNNYKFSTINRGDIRGVSDGTIYDYNQLITFIDSTSKEISIARFFQEVYMKFFFEDDKNHINIKACKTLIDSANSFLEVIASFNMIESPNYEFIKFLREGAKTTETLEDIGEKLETDFLSLSTPSSFIGTKKRCLHLILSDIRNPLYTLKTDNDFQNLWSLNKDWEIGTVFSDILKDSKEKFELFSILARLFRSSSNIHLFASLFSHKGYEQHSIFSNSIDRTIREEESYTIYKKG